MTGNGQSRWAWSQTVPLATAGTDRIGEKEKSRSQEKTHKRTCDFKYLNITIPYNNFLISFSNKTWKLTTETRSKENIKR